VRRQLIVLFVVGVLPALAAAQARQRPRTVAELEAEVAADSLDPGAHYRLSLAYWRAKRYDDEARALRRAIAIDPRYAPAYLSLSYQVYDRRPRLWNEERRRRVPEAWRQPLEESYRLRRQAFLIDPMVDFRVVGTEAPSEEMLVIPDYGEATTDYLLYVGVVAFDLARYELSYAALDKYLERAMSGKPRDSIPSFILWHRGLAAAHERIYNVAIDDFRTLLGRAVSEETKDSLIYVPLSTNEYRYILAVLHQHAGKVADAVNLFKETLANDLGLYMAHVRLAQVYRGFKVWNDAIAEARRAVETNPDDPTAVRELGEILAEAGKLDEAEQVLRDAQARNPLDAHTYLALGDVQRRLTRPAEARASLERFVALAPRRLAPQIAEARRMLAELPPAQQ
jgi:tetratricopeptide (TPR) repeat protein